MRIACALATAALVPWSRLSHALPCSKKESVVVAVTEPCLPPTLPPALPGGLCLAEIVQLTTAGEVLVRPAGASGPPVTARLAAPHGRDAVLAAIAAGQPAVLARVAGSGEPIILSFLLAPAALLASAPPAALSQTEDQVTLRAGRAAIKLHKNGKIVLRGVRIVAEAKRNYRVMSRLIELN